MSDDAAVLASLPLFDGSPVGDLHRVAERLERHRLDRGERLMRQGEEARCFWLVLSGELAVTRHGPGGHEVLAVAGPGSIIGELALLRRGRRNATVTASGPTTVLVGDADAFAAMLELPAVHHRIRDLVARRLAEDVRPVDTSLGDGTPVGLRPLLPSDRRAFAAAFLELSEESQRRRFFTAGPPSRQVLDHLVDLDYVNHFAWVVIDDSRRQGVAEARYVRSRHEPGDGEVAFTVSDPYQRRGAGMLLLGAVGAAARAAGITTLTASMLSDNVAARALFSKASASFAISEPGVQSVVLPTESAVALLDPELATRLELVAREIVTAAGLALVR